jgi:hypothetical protein
MGEPQHGSEGALEKALLNAHPETALAYEVARQLQPILPLESLAQLRDRLGRDTLQVGDQTLPLALLENAVPPEAFPVTDEQDLAVKLTSAVRMGLQILGDRVRTGVPFGNAEVEGVARSAMRQPPPPPVGVFMGPSLFGSREG